MTTQIGDARFTAFRTSRVQVAPELPRAAAGRSRDFVVNDAALAYMRTRALAGPFLAALAAHPARSSPMPRPGRRI